MFNKVLVANRGEIAVRIISTAKKLGIKTVAIYSDADLNSMHVRAADESIRVGGASVKDSYLNSEAIINACIETGSEAVHPGYGFLSENPNFVNQLEKKGIIFIGPSSKVISSMGDKIEAKKIAENANVSCVPGFLGEVVGLKHAKEIASKIGYPVMVKASAGGGGKGMRIAANEKDLESGLERAMSEAQSSFGDDRVFIEKYIEEPRHIEIQIVSDVYGNTIYLGERECSIQRRHQKVIEEAPSPFLDEKTRQAMGEQAIELAKEVGYFSVGTVEFIVDKNKQFYFLEMNTRLQVEHPVTEFVTGIDLVEQMFRIASKEKLKLNQSDIDLKGWSIEARIYAENPNRDFVPSIGRLTKLVLPKETKNIRLDSGVEEGSEISRFYDPMIGKLITYGKDRKEALSYLSFALDNFLIKGIDHNINFIKNILNTNKFNKGEYNTNFISDTWPEGFNNIDPKNETIDYAIIASIIVYSKLNLRSKTIEENKIVVIIQSKYIPITFNIKESNFHIEFENNKYEVFSDWLPGKSIISFRINKNIYYAYVDAFSNEYQIEIKGSVVNLFLFPEHIAKLHHLMPVISKPDLSGYLVSPMPGLILSVPVSEGDKVEQGQPLCIIDAMKMENVLVANKNKIIKKINVKRGDSVNTDQILLEFD